jgi:hypothetical protein
MNIENEMGEMEELGYQSKIIVKTVRILER